ncbi:precorrin-6y C5,15-methyltransferase (decarboxylating) subunit CbiE [Actinomadura rugatobispora]|uniref:Precorrin-6y C5,15-methyltransferase (Decarboxylating) subunit CbiE n=1 Tax=Actinomadura rugatobispora TaxID=1994 RepID=A0ABW0ZV13_9ACTN|nr:bifunctional cobalt-precorrin-7 (C(5))-methyltransferase/cobalt-precorrin-6B (C(15))-methyltransferase [Actinomadura rugatobispora]
MTSPASSSSLTVLGHDGSPLSAEARELLERASLVAGGRRHLAAVPVPPGARTIVMGELRAALDAIDEELDREDGDHHVVVVASGDPGFFGIVRALRERGRRPRVLPALSSVQRAFARAGLSWDDALVVSAHGRELRRAVNACRAHPKVAVLTAPGAGPAELARALFPQTPRTFVVCEDLGGPRERVVRVRPAEATTRPWRDPNVVLVLDQRRIAAAAAYGERGWIAGARPGPARWALPPADFAYGAPSRGAAGTGAEIRAFALAKLGPRVGDMVWDVGAGRGEIAIECARFGAAVVAVERDEAACEGIRANVRAHRVKVAVSRGTAPAVLEHLPEPDAVFVGGGGPDVARACAARALRSVVVVVADADRVQGAIDALKGESLATQAVSLSAAPFGAAPAAPVYVVWGERAGTATGPEGRRGRAVPQRPPASAAVTVAELPEMDVDEVDGMDGESASGSVR